MMSGIKKCIYYTLGFSTTTPLLALVLGGHSISLMYIAYLLALGDLLLAKGKRFARIRNNNSLFKLFFCYLVFCFVSSLFGILFFWIEQKSYALAQVSFLPKILLYLIFFILFDANRYGCEKACFILNGIKYGAIVNIIWCIADALIFYMIGISITNDLFISVIEAMDLPNTQASIIEGLFIRSSGLTIDPCFIGYYAIALTIYGLVKRRRFLILLSVMACFASVSIIGLVGIIIVLIAYVIKQKNVVSNTALVLIIILFFAIVYHFSDNEIVSNFKTAVELRLESKADNDASASTRKLFIEEFPGALMNMPTALFLGTGYFSASYAYFPQGLEYAKYNKYHMYPVPIENMYIETLFAVGVIGLVVFVLFYLRVIKCAGYYLRLNKNEEFAVILYTFTIGAMILFMFYHNVFDSTIMLLSICAVSKLNEKHTTARRLN